MGTEIGVGVVGLGWMGQVHSRGYRRLFDHYPDCALAPRLVLAADAVEDRARESARLPRLRGLDHRLAGGRRAPRDRGRQHHLAQPPAPRDRRRRRPGGQAHLAREAVRAVPGRDLRHRAGGRGGRGEEHDRPHVPPRPGGRVRQGAHRGRGARGDHALQGLLSGRLRRRPERRPDLALQAGAAPASGCSATSCPTRWTWPRTSSDPSRASRRRRRRLYGSVRRCRRARGPATSWSKAGRWARGERGLRERPRALRERRPRYAGEQPDLRRAARQEQLRGQRHARRPLLGLPAAERAGAVPLGRDGRPGLPHGLRRAGHGRLRQLPDGRRHLDGLRRPQGDRGLQLPLVHSRRPATRAGHARDRLDHARRGGDGPLLRHRGSGRGSAAADGRGARGTGA